MRAQATVDAMRRLVRTLVRLTVLVVVVATIREILLERQPQKALHGSQPVIGSLDTWPAVPRKPGT